MERLSQRNVLGLLCHLNSITQELQFAYILAGIHSDLFCCRILVNAKWYLVVLICISLMSKSDCVWLIFVHILVSHVYLLWRKIYSSALFIFKSGYVSLLRNKSSLYSPAVKSIIKYMFYKLFSSLLGCVVFSSYDPLTHKSFHSYFFVIVASASALMFKESSSNPASLRPKLIIKSSATKAQAHCQVQCHKGSKSLSNPVSERPKLIVKSRDTKAQDHCQIQFHKGWRTDNSFVFLEKLLSALH